MAMAVVVGMAGMGGVLGGLHNQILLKAGGAITCREVP
jgi:hypothetical protein